MKKKVLSAGLYKEGLLGLRVFGFIVLSLYLVILIAAPLFEYADYVRAASNGVSGYYPLAVSMEELLKPLVGLPIFVAPVMTLILFSGFNKRSYSDFYHALPYTRLCIFLSYTAAILTWVFGILAVSGAVSLLMRIVFPGLYVLSFIGWADILLTLSVMIFMVVAGVLLGCSFTGTLFSNITASGLILFLPRVIISLVTSTVASMLPFIVEDHFMAILSFKYNILVHYLGDFLLYSGNASLQSNLWCNLYSLLAALIMGVLAAVLFVRRKSETASKGAPRRSIQAGIRIALTLVFSFGATCILLTGGDGTSAIFLYISAILVYFIYELLSTLKWKNLIRIIPSLGIVVLLNLGLVGVVSGITYISTSFRPQAQDIISIRFLNTDDTTFRNTASSSYWGDGSSNYAERAAQKITIDDPQIIAVIADALLDNMEKYDHGNYRQVYQEGSISYDYSYSNVGKRQSYMEYIVAIKTESTTRYRRIMLSFASMEDIVQRLASLPNYREAYMTLPPALSGTESVQFGSQGFSVDTKGWDWKTILSCLQDEIHTVGFEDWYKALHMDVWSESDDLSDWTGTVLSYTAENKDLTKVMIPISQNLTPKTFDLLIEAQYQNRPQTVQEAIRLLKGEIGIDSQTGYRNCQIGFAYTDSTGKWTEQTIYITEEMYPVNTQSNRVQTMMRKLGEQLENTDTTPNSNSYISLQYDYFTGTINEQKSSSNYVYLPMPEDFDIDQWQELAAILAQ